MTARTAWIALTGAMLTAATACSGSGSAPSESSSAATSSESSGSSTSANASTPAVAPTSCTDLGGTGGPDRFCTVHAQTPTYTIDMHYPVDYPDQQAITDVLKRQRDGFVQAAGEPHAPEAQLALDIKGTAYRSGTPTSGTQSLVFDEYADLGGAHPNTEYDAVSYDLGKQAPITFDTLFKPGSDPVAVLDPIVSADLTKQFAGLEIDHNSIGAQMYQAFALTDDAVIFFIGRGMWTNAAAGATHVSVPRSDLASILA
ncbi:MULTISPECIES: esterase [unclassified Mycobacterium]|uniref:esterase n=1 Tax=unclassified Mycobacterium TaxID=2642494 RepID=UPI0029C6E286|nr:MULTISPECIES: esterase [unclassified Mycobacterium]